MILEEFDDVKDAVINPSHIKTKDPNFPKVAISCFSHKLINKIIEEYNPEIIGNTTNANMVFPFYKINYNGVDVAVFMSAVGAPACVAGIEDAFELGVEKLIVFGTCGVLDKNIEDLSIIIPTNAIRDEGTSYHYKKSSREIVTNLKYKEEFIDILDKHGISYTLGKTWTTDGIYRETRNKVNKRKEEGCISVDMESSAVFALAEFRKKEVFQFFYSADNLDNENWDKRSLGCDSKLDEKAKVIKLALELAKKIS